jgi:outer membrane protein TolC
MRIPVAAALLMLPPCVFSQEKITLQDAMERARRFSGQIQSANLTAQLAREDSVQAKAAQLPSVNALNQFIYTEANGTASGVFVANDGVHVYNEQALVHEELFSVFRRAEVRRAKAAEAVAAAKRDIALRGLKATVAQDFYAIASAARKVANARTSLQESDQVLEITRKLEQRGEAAKADVIKAQLQQQQHERDLSEAQVTWEKDKVTLAVLIFPDITRDFSAVDDLDNAPPLPGFPEFQTQASTSPEVAAAQAGVMQAKREVDVARYQYLPSFALDFAYGIDANQFTARTDYATPESGRGTLPDYLVDNRQNLGYSGQITLNIPLWNWGATRSKVKQAELRAEQAQSDLAMTQKQFKANVTSAYLEAQAAYDQIDSLRSSTDLSAESLRLTLLRYQAGEANILEVVDAQTTLAAARNAYADGLARYRVALANIETLAGHL